jgi:transcriptional regulator with XRE-family HTH domain
MVNLNVIKGRIKEKNMTLNEVAKEIGIATTSFSLKINGKREFTASQIQKLSIVLNTPVNIFFDKSV